MRAVKRVVVYTVGSYARISYPSRSTICKDHLPWVSLQLQDGRIVFYDYERTSTPAGISPNGNSFQTALLEPNRVTIGFQPCSLIGRTWLIALTWDTTSQKAIAVTSIRDWLKYDPSLPRHSRSQPGILDCLLVQISQQHGCLCGKITLILALSGI
ncbi:unnamed protein product [Penicillium nalgiovense]|nr:unnamed protein product [Penicillium salamii]CAG8882082.1 unnamed protein product [Penicillium nalgiovense]CAG8891642.1 unnamed protein product [Penicillium salamii]